MISFLVFGFSQVIYAQIKDHPFHKDSISSENNNGKLNHSNIEDTAVRKYVETLHKNAIDTSKTFSGIWNKTCPVLGYSVNITIQPVEYYNKLYGFCCNDCPRKFKKDPLTFIKNLSKEGNKFIGKKTKLSISKTPSELNFRLNHYNFASLQDFRSIQSRQFGQQITCFLANRS